MPGRKSQMRDLNRQPTSPNHEQEPFKRGVEQRDNRRSILDRLGARVEERQSNAASPSKALESSNSSGQKGMKKEMDLGKTSEVSPRQASLSPSRRLDRAQPHPTRRDHKPAQELSSPYRRRHIDRYIPARRSSQPAHRRRDSREQKEVTNKVKHGPELLGMASVTSGGRKDGSDDVNDVEPPIERMGDVRKDNQSHRHMNRNSSPRLVAPSEEHERSQDDGLFSEASETKRDDQEIGECESKQIGQGDGSRQQEDLSHAKEEEEDIPPTAASTAQSGKPQPTTVTEDPHISVQTDVPNPTSLHQPLQSTETVSPTPPAAFDITSTDSHPNSESQPHPALPYLFPFLSERACGPIYKDLQAAVAKMKAANPEFVIVKPTSTEI
ncbi:hypothetical protein BC832DRAFT_622274 [Gaertneriomyces semiglobifer]|nr:hypothetical protein BC832DRAFT_622274 [Gaertneriomyces semiglobifer]